MTRNDPRSPGPRTAGPSSLTLGLYRLGSRLIPAIGPAILRRRLARGREDPDRWQEKLGLATKARPPGRLVWLHAVGLGEVMALRTLIRDMAEAAPDLRFLITSSARSSAAVVAANLPAAALHQYLPLDAPRYLHRFLDHWRPDLSVWSEQDLWPGAVVETARRGIPLALVNARMNEAAFARRARWRGLFAALYARFAQVSAQDARTAGHLAALGARDVRVIGSLKSAAPPLAVDAQQLATMQAALSGRKVWVAASTHAEDEAAALAAQSVLQASDPAWLLILVPRDPARRDAVIAACSAAGLTVACRSKDQTPGPAVYLADTFGELGLWYRLAPVCLIGGTFGPIEGHNPWEPAALGLAILHGPRTANFAADFKALAGAGAARQVTADGLAMALTARDLETLSRNARSLCLAERGRFAGLARDLVALMDLPA